jgi:hypothetical protein
MTKARKATVPKPAPKPSPKDPQLALAFELYQLDVWRKSPEVSGKLKRHEELRNMLKETWKTTQRNAPWSEPGWQVFFVQQQGKSKSVCALSTCGNIGLRHSPEWHVKCQTMVNPPNAA